MTAIDNRVLRYLDEKQITYKLLPTKTAGSLLQMAQSVDIDTSHLVRAVLLESDQGLLCVVLPVDNVIDFEALKNHTGHTYIPTELPAVKKYFPDCKTSVVPPFSFLYEIDVLFDNAVLSMSPWIIDIGIAETLIEISTPNQLSDDIANRCQQLSSSEAVLQLESSDEQQIVKIYAPEKSQVLNDLYSMPERPQLLNLLLKETHPQKDSLEALLNAHPQYSKLLTAYLKHSVFTLQTSQSESVTPAQLIASLTPELIICLLRGLIVWNEALLPADGPLGKQSLFKHAFISTQVAYKLVSFAGGIKMIDPITACAVTINQNVGYQLLYWLFKPEYFLFNRMMHANHQLSVIDIEKQFLAYGLASELIKQGHANAGELLMDRWQFNARDKIVCQYHHDSNYDGQYFHEVHLLLVVNYLLRHTGFGDTANAAYPEKSLQVLGINQSVLTEFCLKMADYEISLAE